MNIFLEVAQLVQLLLGLGPDLETTTEDWKDAGKISDGDVELDGDWEET